MPSQNPDRMGTFEPLASFIHILHLLLPSQWLCLDCLQQITADTEPLAVRDAKLNLWEMSAHHTAPCVLKIWEVIVAAPPQLSSAAQTLMWLRWFQM